MGTTDWQKFSISSLSKGDGGGGVTQWQTLDGEEGGGGGDNEAEITRSGCLKTHTLLQRVGLGKSYTGLG